MKNSGQGLKVDTRLDLSPFCFLITHKAQLGVAAYDKGWAIAGAPRLDLSHSSSPGCPYTYVLDSISRPDGENNRQCGRQPVPPPA
jgi:hypothetical protein